MSYNHYIPKESHLQNIVHSVWQINHFTAFEKEYIIPKGIIEVIFNFSDCFPVAQIHNTKYNLPRCFINGFNTVPIQVQLPKQQIFFGVLFQPLAIKRIFKSPGNEFSDITVDLTLVDPAYNALWHQLAEQNNFNKRVSLFLGWLGKNIIELQPQEQLINNFLYSDNQHDLSVKELANSLCYSPRHLSRKIFEATGMNTEEILLYKKYLHAVHLIHHTDLSLTAIAYQSQFFDQSHFIKSFKTYAKMTPGEYKGNKSYVKGHVFKDVR